MQNNNTYLYIIQLIYFKRPVGTMHYGYKYTVLVQQDHFLQAYLLNWRRMCLRTGWYHISRKVWRHLTSWYVYMRRLLYNYKPSIVISISKDMMNTYKELNTSTDMDRAIYFVQHQLTK